MSSRRLPGKVLRCICGDAMLRHVVKRVASANGIKKVIVATSNEDSDREIVAYCNARSIEVAAGPLDDVVARYLSVLNSLNCHAFLRVTADSPLIDPALIERAINLAQLSDCDLATNVFPRTFPKGQSVEIVKTRVFQSLKNESLTFANREHITSFFYDNAQSYNIANFTSELDYSHLNMSVDTETDFIILEKIFKSFNGQQFNWLEASERLLTETLMSDKQNVC